MGEEKAKRIRRSPEQLAADIDVKIEAIKKQIADTEDERKAVNAKIDAKIADANARIKALTEKKKTLLAPKPPRKPRKTKQQKLADILKQASKAGMKPEEIAERLGVTLE